MNSRDFRGDGSGSEVRFVRRSPQEIEQERQEREDKANPKRRSTKRERKLRIKRK